jgi:beta-glucosidase
MALKAGVNHNCGVNYQFLPQAVREGKISEKQLDERLRPLLRTRFRLGLFDEPDASPYRGICPDLINSPAHRHVALEAARKSIVLLQNRGGILPLKPEKLQKVYLTGPTMADNTALLGNYNGLSGNLVSFLEGIVDRLGVGTVVDYALGTPLTAENRFSGSFQAEEADVVIAAIGNTSLLEGENGDALLSDFGGDRRDIALPANQVELIRRLREKMPQKPLIVVVTGGGAVDLREICTLADAVLFAWYPGEQGGNALADILLGRCNPSGRLPITFYARVEDLPPFEAYSMDNRTYRFFRGRPQFPFGFGLSYTTFSHHTLSVERSPAGQGRDLEIRMSVENHGPMAGDEVVMVYVVKPARHERNPSKSLCGFQRVYLEPGGKKTVSLVVRARELEAWDSEKKGFVLTPGRYRFEVGPNAAEVKLSAALEIK